MTLHSDIWRLPGPASFVRDVTAAADGRHVAAILPRKLVGDPEYGDALAAALVDALPSGSRLYPWPADGPLVRALGAQVAFDDPPVTVRHLITHPDVAGRKFVCLAFDLDEAHREELAGFVGRLEMESRTVPAAERGAFVVVTDRGHLPTYAGRERSEVALASVWYWNRISRWDVAGLLTSHGADGGVDGVLREVRLETVIEVAQWDLDLALRLAAEWDGSPTELAGLLTADAREVGPPPARRGRLDSRPSEALLDAWDRMTIDGWHGALAASVALNTEELDRRVWSAQARVLLPWIELKRSALAREVARHLGPERWRRAVDEYCGPISGPEDGDPLVEIGPLNRIVFSRIGNSNPALRDTTAALLRARNALAHLNSLPQARLHDLVSRCDWL